MLEFAENSANSNDRCLLIKCVRESERYLLFRDGGRYLREGAQVGAHEAGGEPGDGAEVKITAKRELPRQDLQYARAGRFIGYTERYLPGR